MNKPRFFILHSTFFLPFDSPPSLMDRPRCDLCGSDLVATRDDEWVCHECGHHQAIEE